jgi:predicted DNA-binding antitoxin AbrB/MazE fold protein
MTIQETQTIEVIFENGILKPLTPLENIFTEGQHLQVTVQTKPPLPKSKVASTSEDWREAIKRIKTYKSIEEIRNSPEYQLDVPRRAGSLEGKIWMAEDFDAPLEDFKDYM